MQSKLNSVNWCMVFKSLFSDKYSNNNCTGQGINILYNRDDDNLGVLDAVNCVPTYFCNKDNKISHV